MKGMRKQNKKKAIVILLIYAISLLLIELIPPPVIADNPTLISVSPTSKTVSAGQTFTLTIACTPGQFIESYELKISFNPTLLHANAVTQGTIFNGYTTFFNAGTINNTAGTILNIYGLILGPGEVINPGSLISLSFTALQASGISTIGLFDVGVTNATTYVPITVTNGTVTLREYTLIIALDGSGSVTKNPNQATYPYGTVVQLTATPNSGWLFASWSGDLTGNTNPTSITMTSNKSITAHFTQNQCTLAITIDGSGLVTKNPDQTTYAYGQVVTVTAIPSSGWAFTSWTGDLTGTTNPTTITMNGNKAITAHFVDNTPPHISNIGRSTSNPLDTNPTYGWVNVTCTVTDNIAIAQVLLRIHTPQGGWNNVSMINQGGGQYYYRSTTAFSIPGNYSYSIFVKDTGNNTNTSNTLFFSMPPNWDINNDGECSILDLVLISNHYDQTGGSGWIREDVDNNGEIQVLDLVQVSNHFGESWWE